MRLIPVADLFRGDVYGCILPSGNVLRLPFSHATGPHRPDAPGACVQSNDTSLLAMDVGCTFAVLPAANFSKSAVERRVAVKIALNLDKKRAWRAGSDCLHP